MDASELKSLNIAGLYLAPPHGELIWEGRKKTIVRPDERTLRGQYILVSGRKAYGVVSVGSMSVIPIPQFDDQFQDHRITLKERYRWWPDAQILFSHEITDFKRCDTLVPVVVPSGVGMLMDRVEFGTRRTMGGGESMPYSSMSEVNAAVRGIKPPVTLAQANLIAKWADAMEQAEDGPESPWGAAIARFKRLYQVQGGKWVKKSKAALKEVLDATDEGDVVILRGAKGDGDEGPDEVPEPTPAEQASSEPETAPVEEATDEEVAETEESETEEAPPEPEVTETTEESTEETEVEATEDTEEATVETEEEPTEEPEEDKAFKATLSQCVCPKCGATLEHERGEPCTDVECPKCGAEMRRATDNSKAVWTTASINNFPDSSFLYVEPGGKKDEGGKTIPRSKRHFPVKDSGGKVDLAHVRNALSRLGQSGTGKGWLSASLRKRLRARAQRMLAGAQGKELGITIGRAIADSFKSLLGISDEPGQGGGLAPTSPITLVKGISGETLLITRTTNAFKDREQEFFSTQSLHDYVDRHRADETKGTLRYRHLTGSDFGDTIFQGISGRFLLEVHRFHDTPAGHAMKSVFEQYPTGHPAISPEGWGVSHGFRFTEHDRTEDGVYERFEKIETSVLPAHVAANPYTNVEVVTMNDQAKQEFSDLVGDDVATEQIAGAEQETKRLEDAGVEHKELDTELIKSIVTETVKQVGETYKLGELAESWPVLAKQVTEMGERLAVVEKGEDERLKEAAQEMPQYGWPFPFRASQAEETVTDGGKASARTAGKSLKDVASGMTDAMLAGGA